MSSKDRGGLSVREWEKKYGRKWEDEDKKSSSSNVDEKFKKDMKEEGTWESYQKLSPDQQEFVRFNWKTTKEDSKENVKLLEESIKEATKQADPYWRGFLTVAKDEVVRTIDDTKNTYQYKKNELEQNIKYIAEDLAKNKSFYSLEQQSDLAKLQQSYEKERDSVIEDAASKGLTFSTKREVPLQSLADYNKNVVESTKRQYGKTIGDLTTSSLATVKNPLQ